MHPERILGSTAFGAMVLLFITSCADTTLRRAEFTEAAYLSYRAAGTASISGQAFLKTRGGEVRYAAGNIVILEPATAYSEETVVALARGNAIQAENPKIREFQKNTLADAEGRFRFEKLPAGSYFVRTYVVWEYADRWGMHPTGGWVYSRATVKDGESTSVVVSSNRLN
jgi:hypothetical protein